MKWLKRRDVLIRIVLAAWLIIGLRACVDIWFMSLELKLAAIVVLLGAVATGVYGYYVVTEL
jgi:hypothetical protein